ncbi:hypothetical protein N9X60_01580 [Paracoccaceae bacterium]|nr:hypothetical protein [Paracoccaceae bacterium]
MQTEELTQRLEALQDAADAQTQAYESSRDKLYQNIVDAYLWWRDASKDAKYLNSLYKDAGIRTRARGGNQPNFYPLVRLVWDIDISKKASTVSEWAQSLLALHQTATEDADKYSDLRGDLINHIHDVGGLSELRGERRMTEDELFAEEDGEEIESKRGRKPGSTGSDEIIETKSQQAKSITAKAKLKAFPSAVANSDDFVVMLARRNRRTNELEIVGSNYNDDLIESALLACTDIDRASVTPSLRLIAEAIQPHAIPAKLEKYRKSFFDKSKYVERIHADGIKEKVRESTTVLVDGKKNEIVITKTPRKASCVTHVKPKKLKLHSGSTLVMRGSDRSWFERELLNNQKLPLYSAEPSDSLVENSTDTHTRYSLHLSSNNHNRSIYFYDAEEMPSESVNGLRIATSLSKEPSWTITANAQWLAEFDAECVSKWISQVKSHFNKKHNQKIGISVDEDALKLWWWWDEEKGDYLNSFTMPFSTDAEVQIKEKDKTTINLNPKDAMLLFSAIPSLPLASHNTKITGLDGAVYVEYETDLAKYRSLLPQYEMYEALANKEKELQKAKKAEEKAAAKKAK